MMKMGDFLVERKGWGWCRGSCSMTMLMMVLVMMTTLTVDDGTYKHR